MKKSLKYYVAISMFFLCLAIVDKLNIIDLDKLTSNNLNDDKIIIESSNDNLKAIDENKTNNNIDSSKFIEAYVKRVVDGDTIVATIDNTDYKVRMIGINTPESTTKIEEYGKEASNYTNKSLLRKKIYLEKDVNETDKYSRLLRYIWLEIPTEISEKQIQEKMFNAILVLNGYAQVATYPPDVKYVNYFTKLQATAREQKLGLWGL
jgi:micrococcal nuclease